jgi:rhodanese-related sulfurtransferase
MKTVNAREVSGNPGALLLDVRTAGEFAAEHIDGAILLPLHDLGKESAEAALAGRKDCVVICQGGRRAETAAQKLEGWGFSPVVLAGGVNAWKTAGLPLERGRGVISLERQVRIAAGLLVLTGVLCGWLVNPAWFGLAAFVGAGLVFAGVTDFCGMGMLLARMPWNRSPRA